MSAYASVVVPTHDRHSTLRCAIASIQAQSVHDIEILIVGDGPTSAVSEVARSIASEDTRVRFLPFDKASRDGGPNCHRAVEAASSERIFYCDDDDVWLPQHVGTLGPLLDCHDIADTLPVSIGSVPAGARARLHGTLVNSGNDYIRSLLAEYKLKLTYDTHIAHRRSSYFQLGTPWIAATGPSVTHLLATFARSKAIRWRTLPVPTALSLHGAARLPDTESARRTEIEQWLGRVASMSPATLFSSLDFCWHFVRTLWTDPPSELSLRHYLLRGGIDWAEGETNADAGLLALPLTDMQRESLEIAYSLFQGHRPPRAGRLPDVLVVLLDNVLGGFIPVEYALKLLQPFGSDGAIQVLRTTYPQGAETSHLTDLLFAHCLCQAKMTAEAREIAAHLVRDGKLGSYDVTRLLVKIDVAEGAHDVALKRLEHAWREGAGTFVAGLELASTLLQLGRAQKALAVCRELDGVLAGHEWLEHLKTQAEQACKAQDLT